MRNISKYKLADFKLYRRAKSFKKRAHNLVMKLPDIERYALSLRMRKTISSVIDNIGRGYSCWFFHEEIHFCRKAIRGVEEIIADVNACFSKGYVGKKEAVSLKLEAYSFIRQINRYISYLIRTTGVIVELPA